MFPKIHDELHHVAHVTVPALKSLSKVAILDWKRMCRKQTASPTNKSLINSSGNKKMNHVYIKLPMRPLLFPDVVYKERNACC